MTLVPQKFREIVFQIVYSMDVAKEQSDDVVALLMEELKVSRRYVKQAQDKAQSILNCFKEMDEKIRGVSFAYEFHRIQSVEKNILRLAIYELFYEKQHSASIVIAEAIRLAKKFSTKESSSFIHALLDALLKKETGSQIDVEIIQKTSELLAQAENHLVELHEAEKLSTDE